TLYRLHGTQAEKVAEAGDTLPVAQWPVPHRHPLLPVFRSPDAAQDYLLRIENPHAFSAALTLVHQRTLGRSAQETTFLLGVYFGLAGLAAAVALLSAVALRDGTYARYFVAVLAMALAQAAATGIGGLLLWPHAARWNDMAPLLLPVLAGAAFLWFFDSAVALAQRDRRMHRGLLALAALGPVLAVGIALAEPSFRFRLQVPYVACACLAGASILFWAGRRGDRHARWMLWALLPVALTAMLPLAGTLGLLPVSAWTLHAMPVAISLELPALLVILMLRSQERREHGRRLVGLYRTDPATGLPNAPEFQERLALQIARSRRMDYQSVVLLVEVRHPERLDAGFDRSDSGRVALHLAGRLLSVAREVDTV
ncbi:MAG: diguanylate cyclase, partial [Comamonadaceae bacterium]